MRIALFSDLHLEAWHESAPCLDIQSANPDVVVLAGDIHTGPGAVKWARDAFRGLPVVYVAGNHEAYGGCLESALESIRAAAEETLNVHFLNCTEFRLPGVRFIGATLWTDFELFGRDRMLESIQEVETKVPDYRCIRLAETSHALLKAEDTMRLHRIHRAGIASRLDESFDGKTIVVTHMAPSGKSVRDKYRDDLTSAAYASDLESIAERADLWLHGHMHHSVDYQIGKCRVLSNPCGYMTRSGKTENKEFNPGFVFEI